MMRISLVIRYCYLNVKDLYCKWTDPSIRRVRHNKDTVTVTIIGDHMICTGLQLRIHVRLLQWLSCKRTCRHYMKVCAVVNLK